MFSSYNLHQSDPSSPTWVKESAMGGGSLWGQWWGEDAPSSSMLSPKNKSKRLWVCTSLAFAVTFLERSWASLQCCPEASKPLQLCGQNQTQLTQNTASPPLFTSTKKKKLCQWLSSAWRYHVLDPRAAPLRSTATCYEAVFKLLFFSFPQSWPFLDLLRCRKKFR